MGFFHSPIKLIHILKNRKDIEFSVLKPYDWYYSDEGKRAYLAMNTLSQKVYFFYDYLVSRRCGYDGKDNNRLQMPENDSLKELYKIAFIMVDAMVDSNLEFGGISNVMNPNLNPIVHTAIFGKMCDNDIISSLIRALHKDEGKDKILYTQLTPLNDDGSFSDMYKIERDIIWAFSDKTDDQMSIGPFYFNIVELDDNSFEDAFDDDDADEDDDEDGDIDDTDDE